MLSSSFFLLGIDYKFSYLIVGIEFYASLVYKMKWLALTNYLFVFLPVEYSG